MLSVGSILLVLRKFIFLTIAADYLKNQEKQYEIQYKNREYGLSIIIC